MLEHGERRELDRRDVELADFLNKEGHMNLVQPSDEESNPFHQRCVRKQWRRLDPCCCGRQARSFWHGPG